MFGKPAFGSPAPSTSFGTTGLFGQPASTGGGLFNTTTTFGQQNKPATFGFGAAQPNASFMGAQQPQTSSIFNTTPTTGLFGGSTAFGGQQQQMQQQSGTVIKFNPLTGTDTMMKNGTTQSISTKHHSITCMKEYETKSFEELRFEDYSANRKGPQQGATGFGAPAFGTPTSTPSLFGQADANKSAFGPTSAFGQTTTFGQPAAQPAATGFGAPAFGATTSGSSLFGQPDANKSAFGQATAFGQTTTFGQNTAGFGMAANQQTTASPFGKPAFGATTSSTGFGFGTSAPQNANPFGATAPAKPFGTALPTQSQPSLLFGSNTAQPTNTGFGTGLFGGANTQNTGTGLFNKPAQPTTGFGTAGQNPAFSFNTPAATNQPSLFSNTSKPLFGGGTTSTAPAFGGTNNFGTTNTAVFSSAFGKPNPPTFGQNTVAGGSNFSSGLGTNMGGTTGLFGQQPKPGGLFSGGNTLFGNTNTSFQQNSWGLGQTNQQQPSLMSQPEQPAMNLAQLTSDPFGSPLHLAGLEPKMKTNQSAISATDPKELRSLLDVSKKIDLTHNNRLKVTPLKSARDSLFDTISNTPDSASKSPLIDYQRTNVRRLILRPKAIGETTPGMNSTNILDVLLNEDKENRSHLDVTANSSGGPGGKPNPHKLTFDSTVNDSLINSSHSVETQTFNVTNVSNKEQISEQSIRESPVPPLEEDAEGLHSGDGDAVKNHPANVICTRPEYYTLPNLDELMPDENGRCFVKGFTIGRRGYGNVYLIDEVDVSGLNLDEIVHFRYREINVYPDESKKPPVGQGLNRKAQVTLDNVYPRRVGTNVLIKDITELIQMNFAEKLRKVTEKKNARFVDYRPETGSWVFKVDHFSKYGFNDSDEEAEQNNGLDPALKKPIQKQNGKSVDVASVRVPSATELITKESLEERSEDIDVISRENSGHSQEVSAGSYRLDKDIYIDDEEEQQEENDVLHQSMFVDEDSDDGFRPVHSGMSRPLETHLPYGFRKIEQAKSIQVMKSTLFADDDRMSDDARSQISIVKQYLDLPDVEEEMPKLPTLDEEEDAIRKRPLIRPKVWKVLNSCQMPKSTSRILPNRCCVDLGMFKGKSFKAGWSKGFNFYSLDAEDKETNSELILHTIDSTQEFDPLKDILTDCLKVVLEESTHQLSSNKVPTFKILKSRSYLKKQAALFEKLTTQYNSAQAGYLHNIWTLCAALWGPGENSISGRRHLLSEWLKTTCDTDQLNLKGGRNMSVTEATESVFSHLSVFKVFDAAGIAMDNRLPNLSLLVAHLSLPNTTKAFVQEQIDIWYRSLAANHMSEQMKKLYLLLAGIPTKDDVNIFNGIDWKRAFGMHLWYICPNGAPIETAIDLYKKAFEDYLYAERPNPPYINTFTAEGCFDIMYHVLMLYRSNIHRLSSTLNPATHTEDPLDYRLSWLLLQLFLSLDIGLIEQSEITKFCTSFSTQLEHLGHWEWAIFALLHMEDNSAKTILIMGILDRNLPADFEENCQEIVDLLVNEMKLPPEWIHLVKGNKTFAEDKYFEAFNHFALAEEFVTANDIFMDKILPNLFINEQFDVIRSLAEKLKPGSKDILHWHNQTGLILEYLDLLELSIASDNMLKLQMKLCSLSERIVNFPENNDQQKVCVAELSKRCSTLYKEICYKSQSNLVKESYTQFVETLIMPPDFKQNEGLCLLHDVYSFNNRL